MLIESTEYLLVETVNVRAKIKILDWISEKLSQTFVNRRTEKPDKGQSNQKYHFII